MRINNTAAFALAGVIALTLAGCGETPPPPTPSEPPEATGTPQPAVEHGFTFAELRQYEFVFASGAGSWGTVLYVRPDGSFSGTFSDTTWEEYGGSTRAVLLCSEFTGQFTEPVRVNDYTYSVRIARIDYERAVGEEAFADGFHYYYTEPRGLEDTEELLIYLPGAPLGELPQEFRGWVDHGDQGEALLSYALNNEAHQQGFFSRNLVREIIYSLISARDESGELEQQLQDATLSQEERETKAEELYQVWDNELNEVWDALNRLLSPEDMEALTAEELEWIAWKEEQAALAGAGMDGTLRAADSVPPAASPTPTFSPVPAETQPAAEFSFADLRRLQFRFSSGAGAWSTLLAVRPDGSFYGEYHDTDMGGGEPDIRAVQWNCKFTGRFAQPVQVNDYTYSMGIAEISYEKEAGTEEVIDGIQYYYTAPYGLEDAEEILVYLPGAPLGELPQEFRGWVGYYENTRDKLPFYALNNESHQQGFGSYDWVERVRTDVEWAEETAAEYETKILEDTSLSQGELNELSAQMFDLWDIQLNEVWAVLRQTLPQADMEALTAEELEWIAWKEEQLARTGEEAGGGSLAIMLQAQRAAELTRERVYVLLEYLA